jgi:hypothetical protein
LIVANYHHFVTSSLLVVTEHFPFPSVSQLCCQYFQIVKWISLFNWSLMTVFLLKVTHKFLIVIYICLRIQWLIIYFCYTIFIICQTFSVFRMLTLHFDLVCTVMITFVLIYWLFLLIVIFVSQWLIVIHFYFVKVLYIIVIFILIVKHMKKCYVYVELIILFTFVA